MMYTPKDNSSDFFHTLADMLEARESEYEAQQAYIAFCNEQNAQYYSKKYRTRFKLKRKRHGNTRKTTV